MTFKRNRVRIQFRRRVMLTTIITAALPMGACLSASSSALGDDVWLAPSGNWSTAADWSTGLVPASGDIARIESASAQLVTLTTSQGVQVLFLGTNVSSGSTAAVSALNITGGNLSSTVELIGGESGGNGSLNQSGGSNTITTDFFLGSVIGTTGTAHLAGGNFNLGGNAYVGGNTVSGGRGIFNIAGSAAVNVNGQLVLWNTSGSGVNLTGGMLSVGSINTSSGSTANFHFTAGTLNINGPAGLTIDNAQPLGNNLTLASGQTLNVTNTLTNNGTVTLNGGSLYYGSLTGNAINWISGQLTQPTVSNPLTVKTGQTFGTPSIVTTVTPGGSLTINTGAALDASLSNSGTLTTGADYILPNTASFTQTGSSASTTVNGNFAVGASGTTATASVSAGNITADEISLGSPGGSGSWITSGTANVKVIRGLTLNDYIQNAGSTTVLGQNPDDGGDPELTGAMVGGYQHNGAMYLNGGTTSTVDLKLGITAGMTGTYQQTSGVMTISNMLGVGYDPLNGGGAGIGIASVLGGTTNTAAMQIGSAVGGVGMLTIASPGTFNVSGSAQIVNGSMNQTGGTVNFSSALTVGTTTAGSGIFNLTGGPVAISGYLTIATGGTFNQNGGTVSVTGPTGNYVYDSGTYLLQTGDLQGAGEYLQSSAQAVFIQSGGTQEMASFVSIATMAGDGGTYQVTGGTLTTNGLEVGCSPFTVTTRGGTGSFTLGPGATLNLASALVNFGTLILGGIQNYSSGATFTNNAGATAGFNADAGSVAQTLNVNVVGGVVNFNTSQHLASLNITGGTVQLNKTGSFRSVLCTPSLSVTGTLDLIGDDLDIQNGGPTALATITAWIRQGFNNGTWTGTGITSTMAATDSAHLTALGILLNNQSGSALYNSDHQLDGFTPTAANDVLVKYTWYGDANLDGKVDGSDYSNIDNGYLTHQTGWSNGDFNYDGVIDGSDYTLIDNAFNNQDAALADQIARETAEPTAQLSIPEGGASVPEPTWMPFVGICVTASLGRRKREKRTFMYANLAGAARTPSEILG